MSHLKPLPGNPSDIRAEAQKLKDAAADMRDAASRIKKLTCYSDYSSAAVDAATDKADDIHDRLAAAGKRYAGAGTALATWAEELEDAQESAQRAIGKHDAATSSLQSAQASVCTAEAEVRKPNLLDTEAFTTKSQLAHASEQVTQAECDVRAAEAAYNRARDDRDDAAKKAAAAIRTGNTGKGPSLSELVNSVISRGSQFIRDVADIVGILVIAVIILVAIVIAVAALTASFGVAVMVIGVALSVLKATLAVASIVGLANLAATGIQWMRNEATLSEVGLASLDVVTRGVVKVGTLFRRGGLHGLTLSQNLPSATHGARLLVGLKKNEWDFFSKESVWRGEKTKYLNSLRATIKELAPQISSRATAPEAEMAVQIGTNFISPLAKDITDCLAPTVRTSF